MKASPPLPTITSLPGVPTMMPAPTMVGGRWERDSGRGCPDPHARIDGSAGRGDDEGGGVVEPAGGAGAETRQGAAVPDRGIQVLGMAEQARAPVKRA